MSNSNYPKAWSRFNSKKRESPSDIPVELISNFDKLARWAARFRLAKSLKALDLGDHYAGTNTPRLYSAITRIFLTYSAFETYCKIFSLNQSQVSQLQDEQIQDTIIDSIRKLDPQNTFSSFLEEHLTSNTQKQMMRDFINGQDVDISFLAKSSRHIFAHGELSAHSPNLSVKCVEEVSQIISNFLLNCMDKDFDKRLEEWVTTAV